MKQYDEMKQKALTGLGNIIYKWFDSDVDAFNEWLLNCEAPEC